MAAAETKEFFWKINEVDLHHRSDTTGWVEAEFKIPKSKILSGDLTRDWYYNWIFTYFLSQGLEFDTDWTYAPNYKPDTSVKFLFRDPKVAIMLKLKL